MNKEEMKEQIIAWVVALLFVAIWFSLIAYFGFLQYGKVISSIVWLIPTVPLFIIAIYGRNK